MSAFRTEAAFTGLPAPRATTTTAGNVRLNIENLTDSEYLFTQTLTTEATQRLYKLGRTVSLSFGYNVF